MGADAMTTQEARSSATINHDIDYVEPHPHPLRTS